MTALPSGIRNVGTAAKPRYQARYTVTQGGRSRQLSAGTYATLSDARKALAVAKAQVASNEWIDPAGPRTTVSTWAQQWVELRRIDSRPLLVHLRVHILPAFGDRRLGDLTPVDVQQFVNDLQAKGLASGTIRQVYGVLKRLLAAAVDFDLLRRSPCRDTITLPKRATSKPTALSVADLALLEQHAPPQYAAMVHLSAWCGLRWQEAAALRWEHVDLAAKTVTVAEAVKAATRQAGAPKNGKTRVVAFGARTEARLRAHRRDFGDNPNGLLFPATSGGLLQYGSFRKQVWVPLVTRSGLPSALSYHDLRHAYAGHMVMSGVDPKVLSGQLGHHSAGFTLDTYGWVRPDAHAVLSEAVDRAMEGQA